jgi:hypothetical protein
LVADGLTDKRGHRKTNEEVEEVRTEALAAEMAAQYPIPENKRIQNDSS